MLLSLFFSLFFVAVYTYEDLNNRIDRYILNPPSNNKCKTPVVSEGICIPLTACPFLMSQKKEGDRLISFILTGDRCGYRYGQLYACCPETEEPVERKAAVTFEPIIGFKPINTRTTRDIGRRSEYTERDFLTTSTRRSFIRDDDDRSFGFDERRPNRFSTTTSTTQRSITRDFDRDFGSNERSSTRDFGRDFDSTDRSITRDFGKDFGSNDRSSTRDFNRRFSSTDRSIIRDFGSNERSSTRDFGRDFESTDRSSSRDSGRDFSSNERSSTRDLNRNSASTERTTQNTNSNNNGANHPNMRLLPRDTCGTVSSGDRITGGKTAAIDEYPWLTILFYRTPAGKISNRCSGALISSRYVLTAAHCVSSPEIASRQFTLHRVRLGEWDLNTSEDCQGRICNKEGPQEMDIEETVVHPNYKMSRNGEPYDIALIRLSRDAKFNDFIKPICLPFGDTGNYSGKKFEVAGWGRTSNRPVFSNVLMKVILPLVDQEKCLTFYKWKQGNDSNLLDSQMCAGGNKGEDTCSGDSGGPLMDSKLIGSQMRKTIVGIVSFGPGTCGVEDQPAVYTKVSEFLNWILDNLKS